MKVELLDIINCIALFQLAVFISFLFLRSAKRKSNRILAGFLSVQILLIINYEFFRYYHEIYVFCPHLFYIGTPFFFLAGPTFYFYVKSITYSNFLLSKRHLLHALPFLFAALLFTATFYIHSAETKRALLDNRIFLSQSFSLYFNIAVHIHILMYNLGSLFILKNYRERIKQEYSSIQSIYLSWLSVVLYGFLIAWCTSILNFLSRSFALNIHVDLEVVNFLAFFIFFNFIFFKALVQPTIFLGVEEESRQKAPYLSKSVEEQYLNKLTRYMENEKPYLNPNITLFDLSKKVSIPHRSLSEIINNTIGQNYYDFINSYRVKESLHLLSDATTRSKTILEILYEVGFNTKSSFNQAFKKHTGTTPTEYKKQCIMTD
jgi:AraC-like DNA-binding protein